MDWRPPDDNGSDTERREEDRDLFPELKIPQQAEGPRLHPLVRVILYFFIVWLGLQIVVGLPAATLWLIISGQGLSGEEPIQSNGALLLFVNLALAPATLLITIPFVRRLDCRRLSDIGLRWPACGIGSSIRQAVMGFFAVAFFMGIWLAVILIKASVEWGGLSEVFESGPAFWPGPAGSGVATLLVFGGFMIQGGTEELAFRGYIFRNLKDRWSWPNAAAASSFLFAIVHGFNPNVSAPSLINTFLLGLVFALIVERTGSLWLPAILHGFWNFFLACVLSQPVSGVEIFHMLDLELTGPAFWTGGGYGPEGSLLLTIMLLPVAFLLAYRLDRRPASPAE